MTHKGCYVPRPIFSRISNRTRTPNSASRPALPHTSSCRTHSTNLGLQSPVPLVSGVATTVGLVPARPQRVRPQTPGHPGTAESWLRSLNAPGHSPPEPDLRRASRLPSAQSSLPFLQSLVSAADASDRLRMHEP